MINLMALIATKLNLEHKCSLVLQEKKKGHPIEVESRTSSLLKCKQEICKGKCI